MILNCGARLELPIRLAYIFSCYCNKHRCENCTVFASNVLGIVTKLVKFVTNAILTIVESFILKNSVNLQTDDQDLWFY